MDHGLLEEIGGHLRELGHERRETVERIVAATESGLVDAGRLYQDLDQISERAIGLMERQRTLIREELAGRYRG